MWHFHNFKSELGLEHGTPRLVRTADLIKKIDINKLDSENFSLEPGFEPQSKRKRYILNMESGVF